ncbi:cytochrome P450 [Mycena maculata]|uniref:Cytochrome P450 n=1 Tax=Mycena maculata TaxID=230809 RepID=A0AAD7IA82_9AGAR|nr:cytochrome P450 [Mycena maculata]
MALLQSVAVLIVSLCVLKAVQRRKHYSVKDIPGPRSNSYILGHLYDLAIHPAGVLDLQWKAKYGGVVRIKGCLGEDRLLISDPKALHYIFNVSGYGIIKQPFRRELSRLLTGRGLIWAEGDTHRRQRKVAGPAFGAPEIKALIPIYNKCAAQLTAKWIELINGNQEPSVVIDFPNWLGRATLDAIGIAGFDYDFGALNDSRNPLASAYNNILQLTHGHPSKGRIFFQGIASYIPMSVLGFIQDHGRSSAVVEARKVTELANKIAQDLVAEKTKALDTAKGKRDIMSLLVEANHNLDSRLHLNADEMYSHMRTNLLAGYETTSNTLSWAFLELARNPSVQTHLRQEIRAHRADIISRGGSEFTFSDYDNMPYLLAVLKENLRMNPVAHHIHRETSKDDAFPLREPLTTLSGKRITELHVPRGLKFTTSVIGYHQDPSIWGEDAGIFNPDRWLQDTAKVIPTTGVYANLLTFGSGVRACIGWRFAVAEMQAFLVELVENFEFSMTDSAEQVRRDICLVVVPVVEAEVEKGIYLPLKVSLAEPE